MFAASQEPIELYNLERWINIRVIQRLVHHASGVIVALLMFWLVGTLIQKLLHEGPIKKYVVMFDQLVLLGLFVFFAWELFSHF